MEKAKTSSKFKKNTITFFVFFFGVLWLGAIIASFYFFGVYENTPGKLGIVPKKLLRTPQLGISKKKPTLLVFLHPRCPCSHATIGALEIIISRTANPCEVVVVFYAPKDEKKHWYQTRLFQKAQKISLLLQHKKSKIQLRTYVDREAQQSKKFGATISGTVLLYDAADALRFHGGITLSRGHFDSGDNFGVEAIVNILNKKSNKITQTPVFGCSIF
ncbi:hypothetical protein [Candidatus Uabimicrobium amorphum]|uniref:RedB protein n=1 Tax=Uabimicrobium amorphum TaxID=2596890 RepID=A0A5S9F1A1_UABAM|nr:hypothetical protein [Candidatus Uabimicrobium amorphum]BBM82387.1 hypothetical protein UABAM_00730 [Candidatus Uabimicrobium amorphum]